MTRASARGLLAAVLIVGWTAVAHAQDLGLEGDIDLGVDVDGEPDADAGADVEAEIAAPATSGSPTERAREEFAAGIACVQEHETACAEQHFRAALELRDAPAVRYNLASALYDLGRYPEAARLTASVLADQETPDEVREPAELLQAQLREEGGTLQVTLSGATEGAEVAIDGDAIPASQLDAVLVRAGNHRVTVTRRGATAADEQVSVTAGATVPVELEIAPTAEEVAAMEASAAPADVPAGGGDDLAADWRFWAIVGGAVVVIATIVIVAVVATENATPEDPIVGDYDPGVLRWE